MEAETGSAPPFSGTSTLAKSAKACDSGTGTDPIFVSAKMGLSRLTVRGANGLVAAGDAIAGASATGFCVRGAGR